MLRNWEYIFALVLVLCVFGVTSDQEEQKREKKSPLSVFSIIQFPNEACEGGSNMNGTCYTAEECENRGGTNSGSCADGFGVCCTFTGNCGSSFAENSTYFQSQGGEVGACTFEACKMIPNNICQLRLDFQLFVITGPSTATLTVHKMLAGSVLTGGAIENALAGSCLTDTFSVTNPGGIQPPTICGIVTGEHMYVDAAAGCNDLVFQLGTMGIGVALATRQWNIMVTQYSCDSDMRAPDGCTKYFYGSQTGAVLNYNYPFGFHLNNQNEAFCIRKERAFCRICWTAVKLSDVNLSGTTDAMGYNKATKCCGYGTAGNNIAQGYDCIIIPGATKEATLGKQVSPHICGRTGGLVTVGGGAINKTICSTRLPFQLRFLSDSYEGQAEAIKTTSGIKLVYIQSATGC